MPPRRMPPRRGRLMKADGPSDPSRGQMLKSLLVGLFLDAGLSVAAYGVVRAFGYSVFIALLAGALAAGLRAAWVIIKRREIDPFALFMVGIFAVGLGLSVWSGSPRFLLVKESFGTGIAGLAFILTCLRGKPLAYYASQRVAAPTMHERTEWDGLWATEPVFRQRFMIMSLVIGGALVIEAGTRIALVFVLSPDAMVVVSSVMAPAVLTLVCVWAVHYGARTEQVITQSHAA